MICKGCKKDKPESAFAKKRGAGFGVRCDLCRVKAVIAVQKWNRKNPDYSQKYNRRYSHSITPQDYEELLIKQGGVCAICKEPPLERLLAVDHCHSSGSVRGLLCLNCNTGLGKFKDDETLLLSALNYLRTSKSPLDYP